MKFTKQELYSGDELNAILQIPGWAEMLAQNVDAGSKVASIYTKSPWAKRCVSVRANSLSAIPWQIVGSDNVPLDSNAPVVKLLREVSPQANWIDHIRATEADMLVYGSAYWLKISANKRVFALKRLNPGTMEIEASAENGVEKFIQKIKGKVVGEWEPSQIIYFSDYDPRDDINGLSPTQVAMADILTEIAAGEYLTAFFKNYAMPAIIMSTPQSVGKANLAENKRLWDRWFGGAKNKHKVAWADRDLKPIKIGYSIEELAMKDVRLEARRSIATAYEVPLTIAGGTEAINYATMKEQHLQLYYDAIFPRAAYIAGVLDAELLSDFGDVSFMWLKDKLPIMQDLVKDERESVATLVREGVISPKAGALYLGFSIEDVGPGPVQVMVEAQPSVDVEEQMEQAVTQAEDDPARADLNKWRRKALGRLKSKGNARAAFESVSIDAALREAVSGQLEGAEDAADINQIFDDALAWRLYP